MNLIEIFKPDNILASVVLPILIGIIILLIPRKIKYIREILATLTTAYILFSGFQILTGPNISVNYPWVKISQIDISINFTKTDFSGFLMLFILFFGFLTVLFSTAYFKNRSIDHRYYTLVLWSISASVCIVLTDNLLFLLICWELVTAFLFFLVNLGNGESNKAAAKLFAVLGFSDGCLLFGVILIASLYNTLSLSEISITVNDPMSVIAFVLLFIAAIAKAGAIPFHSWIPTISQSAPTPVMAFLPASIDKLLGIYLLARIALDMFELSSGAQLMMMIVGGITIILANSMALMQDDLKKLLSFCAIAQVGYMLLGFGTGTVIGIVGGLFHMLNHAVYKSALFFNAASIERQTGTTKLDKLGGLAKKMPVTFITAIIAIISIGGLPPLNGFYSKWLIYRGVLESGSVIFLLIAMFGSAITIAAFMKVIHAVFLGKEEKKYEKVRENPLFITLPMIVLVLLCILFGLFPGYPLKAFIFPVFESSGVTLDEQSIMNISGWSPDFSTALLLIGLVIGGLFFYMTKIKKIRITKVYVGGEKVNLDEMRYEGTDFYKTIKRLKVLKTVYHDADKGWYDPYNFVASIGNLFIGHLKKLHDGVLSTYLSWCLIGLALLLIVTSFGM